MSRLMAALLHRLESPADDTPPGGADDTVSDESSTTDNDSSTSTDNSDDGTTSGGTPPEDSDDKPDDKSGDDAESKDDDKASTDAPETYTFEMPEGMELDTAAVEAYTPIFKKHNVSQELAQELATAAAAEKIESAKAQQAAFESQKEAWATEARNDKEIGGEGFDKNLALAKSALDKFGNESLSKFLASSGAGSHPDLIRMLINVGELTQEDSPGGTGGADGGGALDRVEQMYGKTK